MNKKLRKIYDQLFNYIANIEEIKDDDYYSILGLLNTLTGQILSVEKWIKKEKEIQNAKEEKNYINKT